MLKVTWRGVVEHPVRFAMSLLAVVLGVAFVTGTFALRTVLADTFHDIVGSSMAADAYVRGPELGDGASSGPVPGTAARAAVPLALADDAAAAPGVSVALPDVQGDVVLVGADGTAVATTGAPSLGLSADPRDPLVQVGAGRLPQGPDEVIVETSGLDRAGLAVGDTTRVVAGGELHDVTVVGEMRFGAPVSGAVIVGFEPDTARDLFAPDATVGAVAVHGEPGISEEALADAVRAHLAAAGGAGDVEVATGADVRAEATRAVDEQVGFIGAFLLAFALVALFVGGFIIANTFAMSVRQRLREIAVMRALGASPVQVFGSVVGQAAIVGLVGSVLGAVAGAGLVQVLRRVLVGIGMELGGSVPVTTGVVVLALVTGVGVSVLAAAVPARRAAKIPPLDAMTDHAGRSERPLRLRAALGGALSALGVAGLAAAPHLRVGETVLGVSAGALLVGVLVLGPVLVAPVARALAWPFVRAGRPVVALARENVARAPRRAAATTSALVVGMALVGAAATVAASTQASLAAVVEDSVRTDLVVSGAQGVVPTGAATAAGQVDGVAASVPLIVGPVLVSSDADADADADAGAGPRYTELVTADRLFDRLMAAEPVAGDLTATDRGQALVSEAAAQEHGWQLGSTLTFRAVAPSADGTTATRSVPVGGIYPTCGLGAEVVVDGDVFDDVVPGQAQYVNMLFVTVAPGADVADVRAGLVDAVRPYLVASVQDKDDLAADLARQVDQVLAVLYALLALSVVIAVLGIVNTLALSVMERTREIGLQRAVGLSRLQLAGTTVVESVLTTVLGTVVGLGVGVGAAAATRYVFEDEGMTELVVPAGQVGVMLAVAALVGVLAALWPAVRAARLPVLRSVRVE
ncbi:ABC transporter permease [Xylanimonas oleitrophica]|uniref:ABC transporter permease n=1 Tax=Xylanimonas oleitrophica TaxID=2607479 RepID=A0A2W5WZM9_9MICO|nr:ABC transporter permease [Xylanimonas oleitrophica]PZR53866.1 ABC transporter permease [Xylanimonas oleitrophica]